MTLSSRRWPTTATLCSSQTPWGGEIVAWQWDFGDPASGAANTSAERSPERIYATPGVYRVTLKVTDDRGTTDRTQQVIEIGP